MDHYEMVENLRTKASVTYEEAKAALEASDWDMLDALVLLESEGKVHKAAPEFTTQEKTEANRAAAPKAGFADGVKKMAALLRQAFQKGNVNQFVITRKNSELAAMPITVVAMLTLLIWPFSLFLLFAGLFLGCRYSFRGPDINCAVNKARDTAAADMEAQA